MGIDVIMVASALAAVATFAVLVAIYAATTVRDPMAQAGQGAQRAPRAAEGRHRRLDLASAARAITNRNEMADKVRGLLVLAEDAPGGAGGEGAGAS